MKLLLTIALSLLSFATTAQSLTERLAGTWTNDERQHETWTFDENGRVEVLVDCGGPCTGINAHSYIDEAGTWTAAENVLTVTINEDNGLPLEPAQQHKLAIVEVDSKVLALRSQTSVVTYTLKLHRAK